MKDPGLNIKRSFQNDDKMFGKMPIWKLFKNTVKQNIPNRKVRAKHVSGLKKNVQQKKVA